MSSTTDSIAEVLDEEVAQLERVAARLRLGEQQREDALRAERADAERGSDARVDAAGDGDDRAALAQAPEDELRKCRGDLVERGPAVEPERVGR